MEIMHEMEIEEKYTELKSRFRGVFANANGLNNARNYISGLLCSSERKNSWQLSERIGESTPYKIQQWRKRLMFSLLLPL